MIQQILLHLLYSWSTW